VFLCSHPLYKSFFYDLGRLSLAQFMRFISLAQFMRFISLAQFMRFIQTKILKV